MGSLKQYARYLYVTNLFLLGTYLSYNEHSASKITRIEALKLQPIDDVRRSPSIGTAILVGVTYDADTLSRLKHYHNLARLIGRSGTIARGYH